MSARRLVLGLVGLALPLACSAGTGNGKGSGAFGNGGSGGTGSASGSGNTVGSGSTGAGSTTYVTAGGLTGAGGGDGACQGTVSKPEHIVVYSPIAIYIMQDRSGSMVTGFPTGSAQSWGYATTAITQFVNDPASAGLYVGLGSFPPSSGVHDCTAGCNTPDVPIASLPSNAANIANAY